MSEKMQIRAVFVYYVVIFGRLFLAAPLVPVSSGGEAEHVSLLDRSHLQMYGAGQTS